MRTEQEMMELILNTARKDERIRAVIMNGSRVANDLFRDCFQDYDIIYLVTDIEYFTEHHEWVDRFGERIILEMPAYKDLEPSEYNGRFNYQMLFRDGNRLDLTLARTEKAAEMVENDPVGCVLLDKDNLLEKVIWQGAQRYFATAPTKREFENSCNSFWWILQNIAKGLKRSELPYAMHMLEIARESVDRMISWYIGYRHDYKVSPGKMGKYFERYLEHPLWMQYAATFPECNEKAVWQALFQACDLYRCLAVALAEHHSYEYPHEEDQAMVEFLTKIRDMEYRREEL